MRQNNAINIINCNFCLTILGVHSLQKYLSKWMNFPLNATVVKQGSNQVQRNECDGRGEWVGVLQSWVVTSCD